MHYLVAVISSPGSNYESLLAPYQQNKLGECPKEYLEFTDMTERVNRDFVSDKIDAVRGPDGTIYKFWDDRFRVEKKSLYGTPIISYVHPEDYEKITITPNQVFNSVEEYVADYLGLEKNQEGKFGLYQNPNAMWDWYVMGGRWPGQLILKKGVTDWNRGAVPSGASEEFRRNAYEPIDGQLRADQALIKNIDWDKMKSVKAAQVKATILLEGIKGDEAEKYMKENTNFSPYAVVTPDGDWISAEDDCGYDWTKGLYNNFIIGENPECMVTIVDCHF